MINKITQRYVDECATEGSGLRDAVRRAPFSPTFEEAYRGRLIDRPWFADASRLQRFADDLDTFMSLLLSLPGRLFDGDLRRYCDALGLDGRRAKIMTYQASEHPARYARPDAYDNGTSFKLLEFNICSALGGLDHALINRALLEVDEFRGFAERNQLGYVDPTEEAARTFHKIADPIATGDRPVVAMVEWKDCIAAYINRMRVFQEAMGRAGIDVRLAEVDQLVEKGGKLFLDGTPIDIALRYFSVDDICSVPSGEEMIQPILRANDAGKTLLYTPLESYLYSNKACLALLSDPRWRAAFSTTEAELIDRILPWSRLLEPCPVQVGGGTVDLIDYCRANRRQLILKPRAGFGGKGAVAGWDTSERDWLDALTTLSARSYIVQERVVPQAEPVCDAGTGAVNEWIPVWCFFLTEEGYAGSSFLRAIRSDAGAVISAELRAKTTSVFTFPAESA
jgi:hypothetical protein